jgi:hypothetical protein
MRRLLPFATLTLVACAADVAPVAPDRITANPAALAQPAALGPNTLSWVAPYVGRRTVSFQSSDGRTDTFAIEQRPRGEVFTSFDNARSETFVLVLRSRSDAGRVLALRPAGPNVLSVGTTADVSVQAPELFGLLYAPASLVGNYWTQLQSRDGRVTEQRYTYGAAYPAGGSDALYVAFSPGRAFVRALWLRQGVGVEAFVDSDGVRWEPSRVE